jgi:hypothetical protein
MMKQPVLRNVQKLRRDMGNMLFHFTRARPAGVSMPVPIGSAPLPPLPVPRAAFDVLVEILAFGRLVGTSGFVKGNYQCVSFTEWPVSELPCLFAINEALLKDSLQTRYEPYGIAVRKTWLFQQGGRPVIYQPDSEFNNLPANLQWRHVRYEPPYIDFTWEREWRVPCPELRLPTSDVLVLVRTAEEAYKITYSFSKLSSGLNPQTGTNVTYSHPTWMAVSLDLFGL